MEKSYRVIDETELTDEELGMYYYKLAQKAKEKNDEKKYEYYLLCAAQYFRDKEEGKVK